MVQMDSRHSHKLTERNIWAFVNEVFWKKEKKADYCDIFRQKRLVILLKYAIKVRLRLWRLKHSGQLQKRRSPMIVSSCGTSKAWWTSPVLALPGKFCSCICAQLLAKSVTSLLQPIHLQDSLASWRHCNARVMYFILLYMPKMLFWLCFGLVVYIAKSCGPTKGQFSNVLSGITHFEDPTVRC